MVSLGSQFSSGDQSGSRITFWKSGFSTCPNCSSKKITSSSHCAGCRMNGDGYGTEAFKCGDCLWETSFQYDDASDTYYYETRAWAIAEEEARNNPPVVPYRGLDDVLIAKYKRVAKVLGSEREVRECMKQDGIFDADIDKFFSEPYWT